MHDSIDTLQYLPEWLSVKAQSAPWELFKSSTCVDSVMKNPTAVSAQVHENAQDIIANIDANVSKIMDMGIGYSDAVSIIAFPLLISLIAFAFPFIFTIINNINDKYDSKGLSDLFQKAISYKLFWLSTVLSILVLLIIGLLSICIDGTAYSHFLHIFPWFAVGAAIVYSVSIVNFIWHCVQFNKGVGVLISIQVFYERDKFNQRRRALWLSLKNWIAQKCIWQDKSWREAYKEGYQLNIRWDSGTADSLYISRLEDLTKYALRRHDVGLFNTVLQEANELLKKEKGTIKANEKTQIVDGEPHHLMTKYYDNVIEYYNSCQHDNEVDKSLVWNIVSAINKTRYIYSTDIVWLIQILLKVDSTRSISIIEKYIDRTRFYLTYIPRLREAAYCKGCDDESMTKVEIKSAKVWEEVCNFHFIFCAYQLSIGNYRLLHSLINHDHLNEYNLYPCTPIEILTRYVRCKKEIRSYDRLYFIDIEELFGTKIDANAILDRFAAMLFAITKHEDRMYPRVLNKEDYKAIKESRKTLQQNVSYLSADSFLNRMYPYISRFEFDKSFEKVLEGIEAVLAIPRPLLKTPEKEKCGLLSYIFGYKRKMPKQPQMDIPDLYAKQAKKNLTEAFTQRFSANPCDVWNRLPQHLFNSDYSTKNSEVVIAPYPLLINKWFLINEDLFERSEYFEYRKAMEAFSARIVYATLGILLDNISKCKQITIASFNKVLRDYTKGKLNEYAIIDIGGRLHSLIWKEFKNDRNYYGEVAYWDLDSIAFSQLGDMPDYIPLKDSILILKLADFPSLVKVKDRSQVKYKDISDKEKGLLRVCAYVDLGYSLKFSPKFDVLKVNFKRMSL